MLAVFVQGLSSLNERATNIQKNQHLMLKNLRMLTLHHCLPSLTAVVTNLKWWHFIRFDAEGEANLIAWDQVAHRMQNMSEFCDVDCPGLDFGTEETLFKRQGHPFDIMENREFLDPRLSGVVRVLCDCIDTHFRESEHKRSIP